MAVEKKFVLLFALLAYTKLSLGNTTGAGQSQSATPCNPININVYGKEDMKGEKGEKGESGTTCKCYLQDPNKPSAHIEAVNKRAVTYQDNTVIKDWSVNATHSHLAGGMKYHDGKLTVPSPGRYYIYAQLYYQSSGRIHVRSQKVCATPYKPVNINVYGKEGVKGEKGEMGEKGEIGKKGQKGDSGKNCKCNLQNPNKPSAHIEATNRRTVTYRANTVIKDWFVSAPNSHLAGGMRYHDGKLTVPTPGRYYIYTQLYYRSSAGRVYVRVNNNIITQIQPQYLGTGEGSLYAGGVFYLKAGDVISLYAQYSISIYMSSAAHSYFGAFLI